MGDSSDENGFENDEEGGIRIGDIYVPPPPLPACSFEDNTPRLMITKIQCTNFKSYANTVAIGPFHKNFSAVVGPNGNGKSNVIDALLFVFGFRASKIRTKKVGILIHKSDAYPNLDSCNVTVFFQTIIDKGENDYELVPNLEFNLRRTACKDNTSFYQINNRRVQYKEVGQFLRSHHIDLDHNRFLILQGEVELISTMKPIGKDNTTGMLEFLEEIVGSNRLIEPIRRLNDDVDRLMEERSERVNRVKAATKEKEDIEPVRNEAVEFVRMENKLSMLQNKLGQIQLKQAEDELKDVSEKRDTVKKSYEAVVALIDSMKESRLEKEKSYKEFHKKYEVISNIVEECREEYSALERQDVVCRENINHLKLKLKKLIKDLETEEEKVVDLQKHLDVLENEEKELVKKVESLEKKRDVEKLKLEEVMASVREETEGVQEEKEKLEHDLIGLKDIVNSAKSQRDMARCDLDLYLSAENREKEKLKDLEEKLKETIKSLDEKQRLAEQAEIQTTALVEKIKKFENLKQQISEKEAKLDQEIKVKRVKVQDAVSSLNTTKNKSAVLQALMNQKNSGNLPGVLGRLGDLGAIDERFDVAISTACGRLDNIVTDTIDTAQKCVEYLKRSNKGYATFIALDKMTKWIPYTKQKIPTPENVNRLFDLVRVKDQSVLPAFYFALTDTLVAKDLEQATRIGLHGSKRYRVVTFNGELIETSGTMTGGGTKVMKGRMGQSVAVSEFSPQEVEKMSQDLDELVRNHATLKEEGFGLIKCISDVKKEFSSFEHSAKKNAIDLKTLQSSKVFYEQQIKEQKPKVKVSTADQTKVDELQKKLDKTNKVFEKAQINASGVQEQVEELHNQIVGITKGKFGAVQKVVDKMTKEIDTIHANITKSKVSAKSAARNLKKAADKVKTLTSDIERTKKERENLMLQYKELETKANAVNEKRDEKIKELESAEGTQKTMSHEISHMKEKEQELKSNNIELRNKLKEEEAHYKEKLNVQHSLTAKLRKLELQKIGDDEIDKEFPDELPIHTIEELASISKNELMFEMGSLKEELGKMHPNMSSIKAYRDKVKVFKKRVEELEQVTKKAEERKGHHDRLRKQRLDEFMAGFKIISAKLKEVYQMVTMGGDAELELMDSTDPFTEGIEFSVRPPKKSWKCISNLSGGEKTLSSLALIFALHYYKPTPFYVMDEIDAALDFRNVSIVSHYIKERTKNAQFMIVSLRDNMYSLADHLVGIFKVHSCSHSVTINVRSMGTTCCGVQQNAENTAEIVESPPSSVVDA